MIQKHRILPNRFRVHNLCRGRDKDCGGRSLDRSGLRLVSFVHGDHMGAALQELCERCV